MTSLVAGLLVLFWNTFCLVLLVLTLFAVPLFIEKLERGRDVDDVADEAKNIGRKACEEDEDEEKKEDDGASGVQQGWKQWAEEVREDAIRTVLEGRGAVVKFWTEFISRMRVWRYGRH